MTANVSDDGGWPTPWPHRSVRFTSAADVLAAVDTTWRGLAAAVSAAIANGEIPHNWSVDDLLTLPFVTNPPPPVTESLTRPCPKCDAPVGQRCITRNGEISDRVHRPRK
jgi:hypothetical protein